MRKGPEAKIEDAVRRFARAKGVLCLKWVSPGVVGVPDRLLFFPGGTVACIEFKAPGKKPTALQTHWHHKLRGQGIAVEVIDNIEAGKQFILNNL